MSMQVGTIIENKLYQRCDICGDTQKNPDRGHLILYLDTGTVHCYRCGYHAQRTIGDMISVWSHYHIQPKAKETIFDDPKNLPEIAPGTIGSSGRVSYVQGRWSGKGAEIFLMRDLLGKKLGYHVKGFLQKRSENHGTRGFGYYGDSAPILGNETHDVYRIVEGPYDVIYPNDLCTFGLPTMSHIVMLGIRNLILCPDGDVIQDARLLKRWFQPFLKQNMLITGVEMIPDKLDPDECPQENRTLVPWEDFKRWYYKETYHLKENR